MSRGPSVEPTKPVLPVIRMRMIGLARWLGQQNGDSLGIGIVEFVGLNAEVCQLSLDLPFGMLPGVVRMIPVEIDHVVGFVIERLVPEAFQEIVI